MNDENEIVRGSDNVFADLKFADAEALHMKARIAAAIMKRQDELDMTVRAVAKLAGCDPADIQRIRNLDIARFTIDRLLKYATRIGCKVELKVTQPKKAA
jgi:predicted XRE-type DNA-binding protein